MVAGEEKVPGSLEQSSKPLKRLTATDDICELYCESTCLDNTCSRNGNRDAHAISEVELQIDISASRKKSLTVLYTLAMMLLGGHRLKGGTSLPPKILLLRDHTSGSSRPCGRHLVHVADPDRLSDRRWPATSPSRCRLWFIGQGATSQGLLCIRGDYYMGRAFFHNGFEEERSRRRCGKHD